MIDDDSCYVGIKDLVLIENSVICKKELEEWGRRRSEICPRRGWNGSRPRWRAGIEERGVSANTVGFFNVFQGVVLTAVSLSASIVTIAGVLQKLMQISFLNWRRSSIRRTKLWKRARILYLPNSQRARRKGRSKEGYSSWYAVGVLRFLVFFTVVFPLSHWRILCYPGRIPYGGVPPPTCLNNALVLWWLHPFRRIRKAFIQAMTKITLRNDLEGKEVKIREGNAGSTRELCTLKPGRTFDIHKDPNATYREYFFITLPDNTKLRVLTSDDFAEFKKISIYEEDGKYDWMDTAERKPAPGDTAHGGLLKRILRKIGIQT